jgi:hypothetical protein
VTPKPQDPTPRETAEKATEKIIREWLGLDSSQFPDLAEVLTDDEERLLSLIASALVSAQEEEREAAIAGERERLHYMLEGCFAVIDPERYPRIAAEVAKELRNCGGTPIRSRATPKAPEAALEDKWWHVCKYCGGQDALKPIGGGQCARCMQFRALYRCPIRVVAAPEGGETGKEGK